MSERLEGWALPVKVGDTVNGKYVIESLLGSGGMGVVVLAMHRSLDQKVAIKFLLPEAQQVVGVMGRFAHEAKAAARLKSEHVARVLDVDQLEDGTPFMVMEYLEGTDLQGILTQRGRIPADEACAYLLEACEALAEAHAKGIVHRDLKPGNLFIARAADGAETVKLLDFGISKMSGPEGTSFSLTKTSAMLGSPLYMPPEQMSRARDVDARADLWSMGVVLYEAVTGTMPFGGESLTALVANIIQLPPKPMRDSGAVIPEGLEELVFRCLEKDPEQRLATVGELARGLTQFVARNSGVSLERISRLESSGTAARSSRTPAPSEPTPARLVRLQRIATPAATLPALDAGPLRARVRPDAVTHAAQTLDSRTNHDQDLEAPPPTGRPRPRPFAALGLAAVGVIALTVGALAVAPSRRPRDAHEGPSGAAKHAPPSSETKGPAAGKHGAGASSSPASAAAMAPASAGTTGGAPSLADPSVGSPAPPATFTVEVPQKPPRAPPAASAIPSLPPLAPVLPKSAPPPRSIEMEPK